jgi:membrane protease YdiL (CAAX protease family)
MIALALLAAIPIVMWLVQSALLSAAGLPLRSRIDSHHAPRSVRLAGRITTQLCLAAVILVYPVLLRQPILGYYAALFPADGRMLQFGQGLAAASLCLCLLFLAWIATHRVQVFLHHARMKWIRRLVLLIPTALFGACVEELLFRGVVMADLLRTTALSRPAVVVSSALIFAGAHYVRTVKRRWTFPGHIGLGILLCLAFLQTGALWLPAGLHAGGILLIMGTRPFFRYQGPAWLTGASIFPFAGVAGLAGLGLLATFVLRYNPAL